MIHDLHGWRSVQQERMFMGFLELLVQILIALVLHTQFPFEL
jgi:hypothetical protein